MKKANILVGLILVMSAFLWNCGGGGEDAPARGTLTMNITDAKPVLPVANVESVSVTFDEVSVHKSGGAWITLATAQQPYTLDLYQFTSGNKTQIVPPVQLDSGKYTQVRIGVTQGTVRISGRDYPLEIPSSNLKTDKNFEFDVQGGGAVDLTVDFDLSQSIVVTGTGTYQLKPVLHLNKTSEAATVQGTINFGTSAQATVIVTWDKNRNGTFETPNPLDPNTDEEYTRVQVRNTDPAPFSVFWLVPNESYFVEILLGDPQNPDRSSGRIFVSSSDLKPGAVIVLNGGSPL